MPITTRVERRREERGDYDLDADCQKGAKEPCYMERWEKRGGPLGGKNRPKRAT